MSESEAVRELRRELGQHLAAGRKAAGYSQGEFAQRIRYARSTVSTVESGVQRAGRSFWDACDRALRTGGTLARRFEQLLDLQAATRRGAADRSQVPSPLADPRIQTIEGALAAYQALGWPVKVQDGRAGLVTGVVLDALEVPRAAGILAAGWWRLTGGAADPIRGLPVLPDPRRALAVIACANRFFFLVAAGCYPWAGQESAAIANARDAHLIGWHSAGRRIPAPPSADGDGRQATWVYLPPDDVELACPIGLLDLLAKATAATRHHAQALSLAGGVLVVPAVGSPAADH
jgi:transcriptional regulator with XRE-family HTH domain